jgi:DNA mismatch repair protein MutS
MASGENTLVDEYYELTTTSRTQFGGRTVVLCEQGVFFNFLWYCDDVQAERTTQDRFELAKFIQSAAVDCLRLQVSVSGTRQPAAKAGFNVSDRGKWMRWLFADGYTIVLMRQCEQNVGGRGRRMLRQADSRVLTPALHSLDDVDRELDEDSSALCSVLVTATRTPRLCDCYDVHVATLMVQAGELDATSSCELSIEQLADHLDASFAQTIDLQEIVVHVSGDAHDLLSDVMRTICARHVRSVHVHRIDDLNGFIGARQEALLRANFSEANRLGTDLRDAFQLDLRSEAQVATLVLMAMFVRMHDPDAVVPLPQQARRHTVGLHNGLLRTLNVTNGEPSLMDVFTSPSTRMGARELRWRLLSPLSDIEELNERLDQIEGCANMDSQQRALIRRRLATVSDTKRLVDRIDRTTPAQIIRLADDVYLLLNVLSIFERYVGQALADRVMPRATTRARLQDLTSTIYKHMERATGGEVGTAAQMASDPFPVDHPLPTARVAHRDTCDALRAEARDDVMQVSYAPVAITLTKAGKAMPREKALRSGQTVVARGKEQQVISASIDRLMRSVDTSLAHLRQVEADCLTEWRTTIFDAECRVALGQLLICVAQIDCAVALAETSIARGYARPRLVDASHAFMEARCLRHPIVETLVKDREPYVPNDVQVGPDAGLLLFGFNSSGKSSLLKSVALAALMAQTGCFVPASQLTLSPYTDFACRIGNGDDLYRAQSSHTREMHEVRTIVHRVAHSRGLVIADEPCTSTEARSAERQVAAMLSLLVQERASIMVATHMLSLTSNYVVQGLAATLRSMHLDAEVRDSQVVFLRTLRDGLPPDVEYGAIIAASIVQHQRYNELLVCRTNARADDVMARVGMKRKQTVVRYNRAFVKGVCLLCGAPPVADREHDTHHNQEQSSADQHGRVARGALHDGGNLLISLCSACHAEIHSNALSGTKWVMGSTGAVVHYSILDPERSGLLERRATHAYTAHPPW